MVQKARALFLLERGKKSLKLTKKQWANLTAIFEDALDAVTGKTYKRCTQDQILSILRIDKRTMRNWIARDCPDITYRGRTYYDPGALLKWRIQYQKELDQANVVSDLRIQLDKEKLEGLREDRKSKTLDRQIKRKLLVPAVDAWSAIRTAAMILKAAIENESDLAEAIERAQQEFNSIIPMPPDDLGSAVEPAKKKRSRKKGKK